GSVTAFTYGFYRPARANLGTGATGTGIGTGKANTASLVARMGATAYTESSGTPTTSDYAGKVADDYTVTNNGVTYSDWFLPSKDELNAMFENLVKNKAEPLGNFLTATVNEYWSSTEYDVYPYAYVWYQAFSDVNMPGIVVYDAGYQNCYDRRVPTRVRPIRAF
ncbi:MAG: DUF1566 domain-containing protein, partial [Spirochaetota bacterium]|nr:DUF1566 domain-containing protein [Spirochaetota bacterium]